MDRRLFVFQACCVGVSLWLAAPMQLSAQTRSAPAGNAAVPQNANNRIEHPTNQTRAATALQNTSPQNRVLGDARQAVRQLDRAVNPPTPQQPDWIPLAPENQRFVDQLLDVWEARSGQIKRYQFDFERWIYEPEFCNYRDPKNGKLAAAETARGSVRYQSPDKGMYEVRKSWVFSLDRKTNQPTYLEKQEVGADLESGRRRDPEMARERWICDGRSIYEYNYANKVIIDRELPPEMQGQGLKNSPIPFLFGVQAAEMKERFWIRALPSQDQNLFILEAVPKRIEDSRNYQKVIISLSRKPFLPVSLELYDPNFDEKTRQSYRIFQFTNRRVDGALSAVQQWAGNFVKPRVNTLGGWKMQKSEPPPMTQTPRANTATAPSQIRPK